MAGVGGSYLRGRSVLGAFHKLQNLPLHDYDEKPQYACCWICSDSNQQKHINESYFQYCLYYGNSYTGNPSYAYLNLKHLLTVPPVNPTQADKETFKQLLHLLRNAPEDETPGKFEKRLNEAKLISGDKYTKRGILHSLALVGIIPNTFISLSLNSWANFGDITIAENQLNNTKGVRIWRCHGQDGKVISRLMKKNCSLFWGIFRLTIYAIKNAQYCSY